MKKRVAIARRQAFKCNACTALFDDMWEIDHVQPLCEGGMDDESNMQALCGDCHRAKSSDEMRARTDRAFKGAAKKLLSSRLCGNIFGQDCPGKDAVIAAEAVFAAVRSLEKGLDSSQVDRYLRFYGLGRQHPALVIVQTMFAESFGVRVCRGSQKMDDSEYHDIHFTSALKQAEECFAVDEANEAMDERQLARPANRQARNDNAALRTDNVYQVTAECKTMHGAEHEVAWNECYELEGGMRDYPLEPLVCVRAGMGVGKSKALLRLAAEHFRPETKALIVTHSRALATKMASEFREHHFVHYLDRQGPIIDAKIVVCLDSVHRVATGEFDFVFLDEAVSLFLHLNSPLMGTKTSLVLSVLELAIDHAKHVYFLDACMDHTFGKTVVDYFASRKGVDAYWVRNRFVRDTNRTLHLDVVAGDESNAVSKVTQLQRAAGKVLSLLQESLNVVVCSSSKSFTVRLENFIREARPETTMLVYNSGTNESLADVDTDWAAVQLLIYSPTVTAGVSFEATHFDALVGVVSNSRHEPTVDMTLQQLFRVRNLRRGAMHVYVHEFQEASLCDTDAEQDACAEPESPDDQPPRMPLTREDIVAFLQSDVSLSDKYFSRYKINVPCAYRPSARHTLEYDTERLSFLVIVGIVMMRNRSTRFYATVLADTINADYGIPVVHTRCAASYMTPEEHDLLKEASSAYKAAPFESVLAAYRWLKDPCAAEAELTSAKATVAAKQLAEFVSKRWRMSSDLDDLQLEKAYEKLCEKDSTEWYHRSVRFIAMCDKTIAENRQVFIVKVHDLICKGDLNFELFKARAHMFRMKTVFGQQFLQCAVSDPVALQKLKNLEQITVAEERFSAAHQELMTSMPTDESRLFTKIFGTRMSCGFSTAKKILHEAFGIQVKRCDTKHDRPNFHALRLTVPYVSTMVAEFGADLRKPVATLCLIGS